MDRCVGGREGKRAAIGAGCLVNPPQILQAMPQIVVDPCFAPGPVCAGLQQRQRLLRAPRQPQSHCQIVQPWRMVRVLLQGSAIGLDRVSVIIKRAISLTLHRPCAGVHRLRAHQWFEGRDRLSWVIRCNLRQCQVDPGVGVIGLERDRLLIGAHRFRVLTLRGQAVSQIVENVRLIRLDRKRATKTIGCGLLVAALARDHTLELKRVRLARRRGEDTVKNSFRLIELPRPSQSHRLVQRRFQTWLWSCQFHLGSRCRQHLPDGLNDARKQIQLVSSSQSRFNSCVFSHFPRRLPWPEFPVVVRCGSCAGHGASRSA